MKKLPLYPDGIPATAVELVDRPRDLNRFCRRCSFGMNARTVCMRADGKGALGGLLVVGEFPIRVEDEVGAPFTAAAGRYLKRLLEPLWSGPVTYDNAVRCAPGRAEVKDPQVKACRTYLAQTIAECKPSRILCMGSIAIASVIGHRAPPLSVRRGYHFLSDGTPVFLLMNPVMAVRNRFLGKYLADDLKWALTADPEKPPIDATGWLVEDEDDAITACDVLRRGKWIAYDTEFAGPMWDPLYFEVVTVAVTGSDTGDDVWVWEREQLKNPRLVAPLKELLEDEAVGKSGHNLKADIEAVDCGLDIKVRGVHADTRIWRKQKESDINGKLEVQQYLVGMGGAKNDIDAALKRAVVSVGNARAKPKEFMMLPGVQDPALDSACRNPELDAKTFAYALLSPLLRARYCANDAVSTARLTRLMEPIVDQHRFMRRTWDLLYKPATWALAQVEKWGMPCDRLLVQSLVSFFDVKAQAARKSMFEWGEFDPGNPASVAEFLFNKLKLPVVKYTNEKKNQASTADEVLQQIKDEHPAVKALIEYRELTTIKSRYADGMLAWIRPDGRIHCNFKLDGARSGRISSSDPNLQNIPSRNKEFARLIKGCFVAPPGRVLVSSDLSQMEYRIAAVMSGDLVFQQVFRDGHDLHKRTAQLIAPIVWGIDPSQVLPEHRYVAKCFHPDTEVLTRAGWKRIVDLTIGEEVMTCEPTDGGRVGMKWDVPTEMFTMRHPSGQLVRFKNEGIDLRVTPDHRMLGFGRTDRMKVTLAGEWDGDHHWMNAGRYDGGSRSSDPRMLRLAVATQADGSINKYCVRFGFTKDRKIARLRSLLDDAGIKYLETKLSAMTTFFVKWSDAKPFVSLLEVVANGEAAMKKLLPWWWLELKAPLAEVVLEEVKHWDAHVAPKWRMFRFDSVDRQSRDVVQALATLHGRKTRQTGVHVSVKDHAYTRSGNWKKEIQSYDGEVACLSVPSTFVLVRDGGIPVVCGQTVNFGTLYAMSIRTLAARLGCSVPKAEQIIDAIYGNFKVLPEWTKELVKYARTNGACWTYWLGEPAHCRQLYQIGDHDDGKRVRAEHAAINSPVQGSAAYYAIDGVNGMVDWILREKVPAKVINTVHDQIMVECDLDVAPEVICVLPQIMKRGQVGDVPIEVDTVVGFNWGNMVSADLFLTEGVRCLRDAKK